MNKLFTSSKTFPLLLAGTMLLTSCASTTVVQSNPSGAKVYLDGEAVGVTPYAHHDTKIVGSTTAVKLEKEGYDPLNAYFSRDEEVDVGAVVGGLFFLFPFLWTMKYKPTHTYELQPASATAAQGITSSKLVKLRELKQLLDEKAITQEEFENEKKKILGQED